MRRVYPTIEFAGVLFDREAFLAVAAPLIGLIGVLLTLVVTQVVAVFREGRRDRREAEREQRRDESDARREREALEREVARSDAERERELARDRAEAERDLARERASAEREREEYERLRSDRFQEANHAQLVELLRALRRMAVAIVEGVGDDVDGIGARVKFERGLTSDAFARADFIFDSDVRRQVYRGLRLIGGEVDELDLATDETPLSAQHAAISAVIELVSSTVRGSPVVDSSDEIIRGLWARLPPD